MAIAFEMVECSILIMKGYGGTEGTMIWRKSI